MVVLEESIRAELLRSVCAVACLVTSGRAASVALLDDLDDLVFVAATGDAADDIVGARFPRGTGIAGHVLSTGESALVTDLDHDVHFARDIAAETGYEPDSIAAVPLARGDRAIGVLSVLDPDCGPSALATLETLAAHAAAALDVGQALAR
jgi:GAF domain-containing protein